MPFETEKPAPSPYSLLDEMHKEIEELRAKLAKTTEEYLKLEETIKTHYSDIFNKVKEARKG